jgi:hypothetical protein
MISLRPGAGVADHRSRIETRRALVAGCRHTDSARETAQ